MNPALAPRRPKCRACLHVAVIEDLAYRLYDPELKPLPLAGAVEYLRAVGLGGTKRQLEAIALTHRRHIDAFLERGGAVAPAQIAEGVSRIPAAVGNTAWVDVNQSGMDIGMAALGMLSERVRTGGMEDKDLISVAKLGQAAASTRASLEIKGALKRAQSIGQLASGFKRPEPT